MSTPFGGLQIAGNTTATIAPNTAAKHTQGWAAISPDGGGDLSVVASVANSRLTLVEGVYDVKCCLSIQTEAITATSGDDVGQLTGQVYRGGSAVAGTKGVMHILSNTRPGVLSFGGLVAITAAQVAAGTNYVEAYLKSGDASGNDIKVLEGQFYAVRLA